MIKTTITQGFYEMPAATLYEDNYLPDVFNNAHIGTDGVYDGPKEKEFAGRETGFVHTLLPYTIQDDYDRVKKPRSFISVTMENEYLKAVILPEIGGRIWSLFDKKNGKELVFHNPVFQPANFALRNAWVAGGIEFNIGVRGHSVFTSSKIYCTVNRYADGRETVKLYEYERIRGTAYSVELFLPDDSDSLFARMSIENTAANETYTYWWTNIAVEETPDVRVLTPSKRYYRNDYEDGVTRLNLCDISDEQKGATYPYANSRSQDYFYKLDENRHKWIVCADKDGYGLAFTSTDRLRGRKLFVWGTNVGGRNWCEFLAEKGRAYAEIQGGLYDHQFEHIPMPARTTWTWTEAYTPFYGDPAKVHAESLNEAQAYAQERLKMSGPDIERADVFAGLDADTLQDTRFVTLGSGWGYVVNRGRQKTGGAPVSALCRFPEEALSEQENNWLALIEGGSFLSESVAEPPKSFMADDFAVKALKRAAEAGNAGAYTYLQLGTALFMEKRWKEAETAWRRSMRLQPNAWAARNIAMLKRHYGDYDGACRYIRRAIKLNTQYRPLLVDCAKIFHEAERHEEWLKIYERLTRDLQQVGRLKYYTALAYIGLERFDDAKRVVNGELLLDDLREGELALEELWKQLYTKLGQDPIPPLPKAMDFRMNAQ